VPSFLSASQANTGNSNAGSFNCTKPSSVTSDIMLVLCHLSTAGVLADMGTPSGGTTWLPLDSSLWVNPNGGGVKIWWKIAGGSEPASYGLTQNSGGRGSCSIVAVQDPGTGTPVVDHSGASGNTTSLTTPSTVPNGPDDFEIRFACGRANGFQTVSFTPPAGFDERTDITSSIGLASQSAATRTLSSGGPTGTHDFALSAPLTNYLGFTVDVASTVTFKSVGDGGGASDGTTTSVVAALAEAGSTAEQLTVVPMAVLLDVATAAEALASGASLTVADSASAAEALSAGSPHPVAESATASDVIATIASAPLSQPASAADGLMSVTAVGLTQAATAADALAASSLSFKTLTEGGAASDSLTAALLRHYGPAGRPRRAWGAGEPRSEAVAASPRRVWAAAEPRGSWTAAAPRRRYSAGPPRTR
jgi:hypothetical protein